MDEYIERDVWKTLPDDLPYKASVKRVLIQAPTADVVPRVEFEAMRSAANSLKMHYEKAKQEVAREIDDLKRYILLNEDISIKCKQENGEQNEEYWKGKVSAFRQIRAYIDAELKKKYTESIK